MSEQMTELPWDDEDEQLLEESNGNPKLIGRLRAQLSERIKEQTAVWDYLQKVSPWSPSNGMDWSDEIICGIGQLEQRLSESQAREAQLEEAADDALMCDSAFLSFGVKQKILVALSGPKSASAWLSQQRKKAAQKALWEAADDIGKHGLDEGQRMQDWLRARADKMEATDDSVGD